MYRASLAAAILLAALPAAAREKSDVVILRNGDHLTGEVKGMERGELDFNTDDAGRLSIEWDKVTRVTSEYQYEAELTSGERIYGSLSSPADGELALGALPMPDVISMMDVVQIVPMDEAFVNRVRAAFDLGFTLAKSNWAMTLSTSGQFSYRAEDLGAQLSFDGYFQDDKSNVAVSRWTVALQGNWYFRNRWRALIALQAERNDELQLLLRSTVASGAAYSVVRNGWTELWLTAGLAGSRETYSTTDPADPTAARPRSHLYPRRPPDGLLGRLPLRHPQARHEHVPGPLPRPVRLRAPARHVHDQGEVRDLQGLQRGRRLQRHLRHETARRRSQQRLHHLAHRGLVVPPLKTGGSHVENPDRRTPPRRRRGHQHERRVPPHPFQAAVDAAWEKYRTLDEGKNADYIPALAKVDPGLFGVTLVTVDGKVFQKGDVGSQFSIQSISKVFTLASVMETAGRRRGAGEDRRGRHRAGLQLHRGHRADAGGTR